MNKMRVDRIIIGIVLLVFFGCSNNSKLEYYQRLKRYEYNGTFRKDRVDLYGRYRKDNVSVATPISYINYVNDMQTPRMPFKKYSEREFLNFYKNIRAKGYGDNSSYWRWKLILTKGQMQNILNKNLVSLAKSRPKDVLTLGHKGWEIKRIGLNPVGRVEEIKIVQRGKSGIAIKLLINGSRGTYMVIKEGNIRRVLGVGRNSISSRINVYGAKGGSLKYNKNPIAKNPSLLPSAYLALEKISGGRYAIYGGGFGHGAGIPQWTAMDLTRNKGYSYKKVLQRYYKNTKLKNIRYIKGIGENIKVGIMTSGFKSIHHSKISMVSTGVLKIKTKRKSIKISPRHRVDFVPKNGYILVMSGRKIYLKTKDNLSISSTRMISLMNIKRNIRKYRYPTYRGNFEIRLSKNKKYINLINILDIERYLLQVVPSEMPKSFGLEALKSQAVAARTYAAKDMLRDRYKNLGFHILDSAQSQVYNNLDENEVAERAIKETKGQILVYKNRPIDAKYYSTSSGFNSSAHNIW